MSMNPASLMKIMNAKNKFTANHPKFAAFIRAVFSHPLEEGTVLEVTLTRPGQEPITSNIRILQDDLDLINELKTLS